MRSLLKWRATKSLLLPLALLAALIFPAAPAQAAWAAELPLNIQVLYYYYPSGSAQLGRVDGTVQFDDGGSALRYNLTFCRQSSYSLPYMTINVNSYVIGGRKYATWITNIYPPYAGYSSSQPCYGQTGTVYGEFTYANFSNVEFLLYGSTFVGSTFTTVSQDRIYYNPY
ncbi:MAG TPA: hypothetical protein VF062_06755 [Candidatus Limnocylindrales bacterium]